MPGRYWQGQREVRDKPGTVRPGNVVQRDEPVVGQAEESGRRRHAIEVPAAGSIVSMLSSP